MKRFSVSKVDGKKNIADIMTKFVDQATLQRHLVALGIKVNTQRSSAIPAALR